LQHIAQQNRIIAELKESGGDAIAAELLSFVALAVGWLLGRSHCPLERTD
jgi:hypothetical protein